MIGISIFDHNARKHLLSRYFGVSLRIVAGTRAVKGLWSGGGEQELLPPEPTA
jgi:hypothetical protein